MCYEGIFYCFVADIQEFYEQTLTNDQKSLSRKTYEAQQIASKWESNPPFSGYDKKQVTKYERALRLVVR